MRYWLIIFMAILGVSCSNNSVPKGILSDKEITPVIVELHLAEAIYNQRYASDASRENYQEDLYLSILKKYKLDQKVFEESVLYYGKHPDKYKPIYDEVLDRLHEMEAKARAKDSIENRKPAVKDIAKDTAHTPKPEAKAKDSAQIKTPEVKSKPDVAIPARRTIIKGSAKDSAKVVK